MGSYLSMVAMWPPSPAHYNGDEVWLQKHDDVTYFLMEGTTDTVIIVSHGNAEDLGDMRSLCALLSRETGASVLAYEYPGYGDDLGGTCSFEGMVQNLRTMQGLTNTYEHVFLLGVSLGTGATCEVAESMDNLAGVILISPFTSVVSTVLGRHIGQLDAFHNHERVTGITCPVHVMHGTDDRVVPYSHGETLYNLAPNPGIFKALEGLDHNETFSPGHTDAIVFLKEALGVHSIK